MDARAATRSKRQPSLPFSSHVDLLFLLDCPHQRRFFFVRDRDGRIRYTMRLPVGVRLRMLDIGDLTRHCIHLWSVVSSFRAKETNFIAHAQNLLARLDPQLRSCFIAIRIISREMNSIIMYFLLGFPFIG